MSRSDIEAPTIILYYPQDLKPGEMAWLRETYQVAGWVLADAAIVDELYVDNKGRVTGGLIRHDRLGECHVYLLDIGGLDYPVGILARQTLDGVTNYLLFGMLRATPRTTWWG